MASRWSDHFDKGAHEDRPPAATIPEGALFACSTHHKVYQAVDGSWTEWFASTSGPEAPTLIAWPTGSEPPLAGVADGTLWVEYTP